MVRKVILAFICAIAATSSFAAPVIAGYGYENVQMNDPQRWHREDMGPRARYENMKREAAAAYQQSMNDCRSMRGRDAMNCRREAKSNFDQDMRHAQRVRDRREDREMH